MRRWAVQVNGILGLSILPSLIGAQEACKPVTEANKLPALATLVDSAALIAGLPAPNEGGPTEVVISVLTGPAPQAHIMDSLSAEPGTVVKDRVLASLKPGTRSAIPAFRIRVLLGATPAVYVEPSILCDPKPIGPPGRASFTVVTPGGPGAPRPPRPRDVNPRIKIGVNGEVLQVDLLGGTGYPEGDRSLRQSLEAQRFSPARLDGRPVQVWFRDRKAELVR